MWTIGIYWDYWKGLTDVITMGIRWEFVDNDHLSLTPSLPIDGRYRGAASQSKWSLPFVRRLVSRAIGHFGPRNVELALEEMEPTDLGHAFFLVVNPLGGPTCGPYPSHPIWIQPRDATNRTMD